MGNQHDQSGDLLYDQNYSWVKINGDEAILGITKPAADKVQEFVFANLPEKGQKLSQGDTYASLEAMKWSGHLSSPLSGEVVEVNDEVFEEPSIINQDPYGKGWLAKIKLTNPEEKKDLFTAEQLKEKSEEE